jgi:hypothetical protein
MFDKLLCMPLARTIFFIGEYKVGGPWWHINIDNVYENQEDNEQQ